MNHDDPRNIFVNQRNDYSRPQNPQQGPSATDSEAPRPQNSADDYQTKLDQMRRLASKYEREGEGQLVKDIVNNVLEQKARGQLSNEQLTAFANRLRPLLNAEQRTRLDGLLEQLLRL